MRFNILTAFLAGASLVQYAAASPIRVVVVANSADVSTNVSFGGDARPIPVIPSERIVASTQVMQQGAGRHHCSQFKDKALAMSNKFRAMMGLPPIEPEPIPARPMPFLPPPPVRIPPAEGSTPGRVHILPIVGTAQPEFRHAHGYAMHQYHHRGSFMHRVHRALMTLGPWEGRAVAFVLGCGIGVLLRMLWVLAIVVARTVRGGRSSDDSEVHDILVFEADAEDILVPAPQYTDEKVALAVASDSQPQTKA